MKSHVISGLVWSIAAIAMAGVAYAEPTPALQKLSGADTDVGDWFSEAMSCDGDWLIVGAQGRDDVSIAYGAAYVFFRHNTGNPGDPLEGLWEQSQRLHPSDQPTTLGFAFGNAVAMSSSHALVATYNDEDNGPTSGAVYVYRREDSGTPGDPGDDTWIEEVKLLAPDGEQFDRFGQEVAIHGDWIIAGSRGDDDGCTSDPNCNTGSAYMFYRDDNGTAQDPSDDLWVYASKLQGSDTGPGDWFGSPVALDGSRALIGARRDDDVSLNSGAAYVFRHDAAGTPGDYSDDTWLQEAKLLGGSLERDDLFGGGLAIEGERLIVGSNFDDEGCPAGIPGCDAGAAYIFRLNDNGTPQNPTDDTWDEEVKLIASDAAQNDWFGQEVALVGNRAIVGVDFHWGVAHRSGSVYVFELDDFSTPDLPQDDRWLERAKLIPTDAEGDDLFGGGLAVSQDVIYVGAPADDDLGGNAGAFYAFENSLPANTTPIPTVSTWGFGAMALMLLTSATILLRRVGLRRDC